MEVSEIIPHHHNSLSRWLFSKPIQPIPETREHSVLDGSVWNWLFWNWIGKILRRGYDRVIMPEDIPYVPKSDAMKWRFGEYKSYLDRHKPTSDTHYREIWALLYAIRWRLFAALGLKLVASGCQVAMTLISRELIEQAEDITDLRGHGSHGKVTGYILGNCAMDSLLLICDLTSMYCANMNAEYARTLMISCIHDKMLRLGPQQRHDYSPSKIMTISSSDCRRASTMFIQVNALLVLPVYFGGTLGILIYMIGISGLPGVGVLLIGFIVSAVASYYAASLRVLSMPYQDRRVSVTRETLKNINIIKFYGWENSFYKLIRRYRAMETKFIRFLEMLDAFNIGILLAAPNLAGALSFGVKIVISHNLPPSRAFPSLILFQMFTPVLAEVSFALTTLADAVVAANRLNAFFRLPEVPSYIERPSTLEQHGFDVIAVIEHGFFSWTISHTGGELSEKEVAEQIIEKGKDDTSSYSDSMKEEKMILKKVNIVLHRGTMNLVIGSVGTGKTSLLNTFVNLIPKSAGSVKILDHIKISSVLSLWSQNCSARDNILFGNDFDSAKYHEVIRICDLESDFKMLSHGDLTDIGENGVTLSGGQRARLALARCLYSSGDLIILDDVLSAMDAHVSNHIYKELIKMAHENHKTILFSTNNVKLISQADWVLRLDGTGTVSQTIACESQYYNASMREDSSECDIESQYDLKDNDNQEGASSISHSQVLNDPHEKAASGFVDGSESETVALKDSYIAVEEKGNGIALATPTSDAEMNGAYSVNKSSQMEKENRAIGAVQADVLIRYFRLRRPVGLILGILVILSVICYATSEAMSNVVLNWWTSDRFVKSPGFNLGMYTLVVSLVAVFYAIFANLLSFTATASSTSLHNSAVRGLYFAPMAFFQKNPLGRIMMRFTEDIVNLDTRLLAYSRVFFMSLFALLASAIVVFVYIPWVLLCMLPVIFLSYILMSFYRTTSREINRCQQLFDSRGMTAVNEHIDGQEVIVAFGQNEQSQVRLNQRMDDVVSAVLHNEAANFWMAFRGGVMCEIVNMVTIFLACFQVLDLNSSEVGTLISILPFIRNSLTLVFPLYALFDNQLNSVERLDEYAIDVKAEGIEVRGRMDPELDDWTPIEGSIRFEGVHLRYGSNLPLALNDFWATMKGGTRIGICGRTGAGKSTIVSALFRLVELSNGSITIDGQDISELPLATLRRSLSIIPQQSILFQGTIRSNLDPFEEKTDDEIICALENVGLGNFSLSAVVDSEGTNFSLGQRQMLALCRAILRDSKILVLDEATAAVDHKTDERIQYTIRSVFSHCTVLCIAHRLETVLDYDEILVLGPGGVKLEMGPPRVLWSRAGSVFRSMCDDAGVSFDAASLK